MATLDAVSRQRDALPSINYLDFDRTKRDGSDYSQKHPAMAGLNMTSAALVSPATMYSGPPPPYSYPSSTASTAPALAGLISPPDSRPTDPRRTSGDEKEPRVPQRHSLPSIHEALGAEQHLSYTAPPPVTAPPTQNPQTPAVNTTPSTPAPRSHPEHSYQGPPTSYSQTLASYPYPNVPRQSQPGQPQQSPYLQKEASFARFSTNSHEPKPHPLPSLKTAQSPIQAPHPGVPATYQSQPPSTRDHPSSYQSHHSPGRDYAPKSVSSMTSQYGYGPPQHYNYPRQPACDSPTTYQAPSNIRSSGNQYATWRSDGSEINRAEEGRKTASQGGALRGQAYGESVKRHLDIFDLETSLNEIADGSGKILDFSRHYGARAHQTQRSGPIPGSTPTLSECDDMIRQHNRVHDSLSRIREVLISQQHALADQRAQDQGYKGSLDYEGEDTYHEDLKGGGGFAGADAKKRRGRAAPPGRCHSCNRAETPEWRRGPDGARTLCNACGLHYAKLTRKMGSKASLAGSNLRPKSMGPGSP
ncbi:MAG: hypothetical protein M1827_004425 [Pycnora praestabilis]|nr:MAG: hypothetical protein M1827_004425 [Pycnora praestabilis]